MEREFNCERCGIHVTQLVYDPSDEPMYCAECRFIEQIEQPAEKAAVAKFIDEKNAR